MYFSPFKVKNRKKIKKKGERKLRTFSSKWISVLNEITEFTSVSHKVWYRGQNNNHPAKDYKLRSGIFRLPFSLEDIMKWEYISYKRFMENGFDIHKTENEWDLLYIMQQFGLKTRLLDWTESFAVSLYFATRNWKEDSYCSIWMLDPYRMNKLLHDSDELLSVPRNSSFLEKKDTFTNSIALSPYVNTTRGMSQRGYFTLQGNTILGLEEEGKATLIKNGVLKHVKLTPDLSKDIVLFMELSGINHFTLFPDLTGLASFVNQWATEEIEKQKNMKS
jgi:hypothetical protein